MNPETSSESQYWRSKLDAYMHDNVSKALDVKNHEARAYAQRVVDAINEHDRYDKEADFLAAAADRFPFPHAGKMKAPFDGKEHPFKHPLDGTQTYKVKGPLTADLVDETTQGNRTYLEESNPQADFIARWRFWRLWTQERNPALAFLPADTRIPDHTIWNHNGLVSAFDGCMSRDPERRPALLLFSIGPVQPLIAAARRIGDLWSGSFLLSYLTATGLGKIARLLGPDHILFPSAWGQPLVDLQLKSIYEQAKVRSDSEKTLWDQLWRDNARSRQRYLLPSLPNRFLALVPASEAEAIAKEVAAAIRETLLEIGSSTEKLLERSKYLWREEEDTVFRPDRIEAQLRDSLEVNWYSLPLPRTIEEAETWGRTYLPKDGENDHPAAASLQRLRNLWKALPKGHHTSYGLLTATAAWPLHFATLSWALDATKQTRLFESWCQKSQWTYGTDQNKDGLTGKEEVVFVAAGREAAAEKVGRELLQSSAAFRPNERLGALTLLKRVWHVSYLKDKYGFKTEDFRMPDTHQLSLGHPYDAEAGGVESDDESSNAGYIAVLALDGDEMGKWISGAKTPPLKDQLAGPALRYFTEELPELDTTAKGDIHAALEAPRPLNPSFHLQFSEALTNFGLYTARRIVEAHNGRLIYAGGDDVLALLPSATALSCARALRAAFRGDAVGLTGVRGCWTEARGAWNREDVQLFDTSNTQPGFLRLHPDLRAGLALQSEPLNYDILLPGPAADVSCGIAIGHAKSPLQDLVRAAQTAEKRAKHQLGRSAFSLAIFKRSGEIVHWGAKWTATGTKVEACSPALTFFETLSDACRSGRLGNRFTYKFAAVIEPYFGGKPGSSQTRSNGNDPAFAENAGAILRRELLECLKRSEGLSETRDRDLIQNLDIQLEDYWSELEARMPGVEALPHRLEDLYSLLQSLAWSSRSR